MTTSAAMVQATEARAASPANGTATTAAAIKAATNGSNTHPHHASTYTNTPPPPAPGIGTPPVENGNASAAAVVESGNGNGAAPKASTPEAKEAAELRKKEDEIAAKGAEIADIRALLARAFNKPIEEPARPKSHWSFLLEEMKWLAVDFSQERLWRRTAALAVAFEIAKKKGEFGLKQPPREFCAYSDEIRELRAAAAKADGAAAVEGGGGGSAAPPSTGRRSSARKADASSSGGGGGGISAAVFLCLDPATDPAFADFEAGEGLLLSPSTPTKAIEVDGGAAAAFLSPSSALAFPCEEAFTEALHKSLMTSEVDRLIQADFAYRSYKLEYEASVVSHQMAVQEEMQAANNIGDLGLGPGFGIELEEPDVFTATTKKAGKRRKGGAGGRSGVGGGILGLEDFSLDGGGEEEFGAGAKRSASKAALVEDVYLRKKRPTRTPAYRDVDVDYDLAQEGGSRYGTRRATGALARNQARVAAERNRRGGGGRADAYAQQQAARARAQAGLPGMMLWTRGEDDLLLAVVHEFGINWTLVSEVLSLSLSMQGIHRPAQQCRQRFRQLTMQENQDYSEERVYASLAQTMSKQQARELLVASLPVRDDALVRLLEALVQVGASAAQKRANEERRNEAVRTQRQPEHVSYTTVMTTVMSQSQGRRMSPIELCQTVNNMYLQQARQQVLMQQQQQQQAAMQAQHAAAVAAQHGQHGAGGGAAASGIAAGLPQQQQQQGGEGVVAAAAQGTPAGQQPLAMQQQLPPPAGGTPVSSTGISSVQQQQQQQGMSLAGKPPAGPTPQVTLQQLTNILSTNKLPNGQPLDENMRKAIESKRTNFLAQIQQQQAAAVQRQQQQLAAAQQQQQSGGGGG